MAKPANAGRRMPVLISDVRHRKTREERKIEPPILGRQSEDNPGNFDILPSVIKLINM
jgi:hypothetical protein